MINNELAKRIHQNAINKGFWDRDLSIEHCLMLVITELSEAVEADRKGKRSNVEQYVKSTAKSRIRTDNPMYFNRISFENNIKDTVEDELADAVIRLCDVSCHIGIDLASLGPGITPLAAKSTFTEDMYYLIKRMYICGHDKDKVKVTIENIIDLCDRMRIDLNWHIEQKMLYNETREKMHGKAY